MTNEALKEKLAFLVSAAEFEENSQWPTVYIEAASWPSLASTLRTDPELQFDYLFCLTCIDWKTHLTMVYHLDSTVFRHNIVIKARLDRNHPEIASVTSIWKTADFHEREVFEMFGVHFSGHPDLRILILPEGWEGKNPLRKDFEDPVNMIRL